MYQDLQQVWLPTNSGSVAINQIYNPATNKWTSGATMPTPRFSTASGVVNNILYVIGGSTDGSTPLSVVEAYDPSTNTWSTKAPCRRLQPLPVQ